jgi:hypothetical protein
MVLWRAVSTSDILAALARLGAAVGRPSAKAAAPRSGERSAPVAIGDPANSR